VRVDTRAGSKDYIAPLKVRGVPAEGAFLEAGDIEIIGNGLGGCPTLVGVEVKTWSDILQCIHDGRFADQQRKMKAAFEVRWLLAVGDLDKAMRHVNGHTVQGVYGWVLSNVQAGGTLFWQSPSQSSAVEWLHALWLWWTAKDYEQHRSHMEWYRPLAGNYIEEPSATQEVAVVLPNIGTLKSAVVAEHFKTPHEMVNADGAEWRAIPGISGTTWRRIDAYLRRGVRPKRNTGKPRSKR
jgi:ERCC4-type nuclease